MSYQLQVSCPTDLVITNAIINNDVNIKLIILNNTNGLTLYYGYCNTPLPNDVKIRFLPLFKGRQLCVNFFKGNSISYYHNYQQLDDNHVVPENDNFTIYFCKDFLLPIVNTKDFESNYKYNSLSCFITIIEYKINKLK